MVRLAKVCVFNCGGFIPFFTLKAALDFLASEGTKIEDCKCYVTSGGCLIVDCD